MVPLIFVKICDVSSSLSMTVKALLFSVLPMSAALALMKKGFFGYPHLFGLIGFMGYFVPSLRCYICIDSSVIEHVY
jgi:hypothetical protein